VDDGPVAVCSCDGWEAGLNESGLLLTPPCELKVNLYLTQGLTRPNLQQQLLVQQQQQQQQRKRK
jgi:hypothetical protein